MGITIDLLNRRFSVYVTCDNCGLPILGRVAVDPPGGVRDYERFSHADGCPDDDLLTGDVTSARPAPVR
jgi:hypothetical protein